jgi:urease accessory protein
MGGVAFMAGFAMSTAVLHLIGLGAALALLHINKPSLVRLAGAACVLLGLGLTKQFM